MAQESYGMEVFFGACGRYIVFYSKCWVRVVALGGSSLGMGLRASGGYILS